MAFKTIAKSCFLELCRQLKKQFCNTNAAIFATETGPVCNAIRAPLQHERGHFATEAGPFCTKKLVETGPFCNANRASLQGERGHFATKTGLIINAHRHTAAYTIT